MKEIISEINHLHCSVGRTVRLMEVCGTHTVAIFRHGIRNLLPEGVQLISGPGCPVCVTSVKDVDTIIELSKVDGVIIATFGDMMRVPGDKKSLFNVKAEGSDIKIVYSPLDALRLAEDNHNKKIVFFATGFETTSPLVAATMLEADQRGIDNFYIYSVHKTVPPALKALVASGEVMVDGFILPGHVSTIIGKRPYHFIAAEYHKASVITGFDAFDILTGIKMLLEQICSGRAEVENEYTKVVREEGNPRAVSLLEEYFEPVDAHWRGIGMIPGSGLAVRQRYGHRDISNVIDVSVPQGTEPKACSCGEVLKGIKVPPECALFGRACSPEKPVGACMVSSEGSCAAYYKYGAFQKLT